MNLNVGFHRTKPKSAKVKNSHLIEMMSSLVCAVLFLCVVGIFSSLKFDPPYVCVYIYMYNDRTRNLFWWQKSRLSRIFYLMQPIELAASKIEDYFVVQNGA